MSIKIYLQFKEEREGTLGAREIQAGFLKEEAL